LVLDIEQEYFEADFCTYFSIVTEREIGLVGELANGEKQLRDCG